MVPSSFIMQAPLVGPGQQEYGTRVGKRLRAASHACIPLTTMWCTRVIGVSLASSYSFYQLGTSGRSRAARPGIGAGRPMDRCRGCRGSALHIGYRHCACSCASLKPLPLACHSYLGGPCLCQAHTDSGSSRGTHIHSSKPKTAKLATGRLQWLTRGPQGPQRTFGALVRVPVRFKCSLVHLASGHCGRFKTAQPIRCCSGNREAGRVAYI